MSLQKQFRTVDYYEGFECLGYFNTYIEAYDCLKERIEDTDGECVVEVQTYSPLLDKYISYSED